MSPRREVPTPPEGEEEATPIISVAMLSRRLKQAVEGVGGDAWTEGEVGGLRRAGSGHAYFQLKDEEEDAVVDCVMYRYQAQKARAFLVDGARLQVRGKATVWAPRGRLQFTVERARPKGQGALLEALERLKAKLAAEGLFAPDRKRSLPDEPRVIGVVTSGSGAAFHDIRKVAFRRGNVRLVLAPALVQGEAAAESMIRALDLIERHPAVEVIVIGRGGGSREDLMAFNDEGLVRRLARARVPTVSAVGHEIDTSLTDLVADLRAATPSHAAELVVPDDGARLELLARGRRALQRAMAHRLLTDRDHLGRLRHRLADPRLLLAERQQYVDELSLRLERAMARPLREGRHRVMELERRLARRHPRTVLAEARGRLNPRVQALHEAMRRSLERHRSRLGTLAARLDGLSPLSVLSRGYAIALRRDGRALRSAREVRQGTQLRIVLHEGEIEARVTRAQLDLFGGRDPSRGNT